MNLSRRYQVLPVYAYCATLDCAWTDTGRGTPHSDAETHVETSGHEVRVMEGGMVIIRPQWAANARPLKCPTCHSPQPSMHPAISGGGEVTRICPDAWHGARKAWEYIFPGEPS